MTYLILLAIFGGLLECTNEIHIEIQPKCHFNNSRALCITLHTNPSMSLLLRKIRQNSAL